MRPIRKILVAIKHLKPAHSAVLAKAARIATACDAQLELFHDLSTPVYLDTVVGAGGTSAALTRAAQSAARARLEKLAAPLRATGLTVTTAAVWDYPPSEAIVRRALAIGADLIINAKLGHHRLPALMGYTDWDLLRISPVPLLLVKGARTPVRATVVAAVDPMHSLDKPAALDTEILAAATMLGEAYGAAVHAVHVLPPWEHAGVTGRALTPELLVVGRKERRDVRGALKRLAAAAGLGATRTHLLEGLPDLRLPAAARRLRAEVVVMGAMSRRGLKRLFLGNTAERLLDNLRCDVLIIKPAGFVSRLSRQRRGAYFLPMLPMA